MKRLKPLLLVVLSLFLALFLSGCFFSNKPPDSTFYTDQNGLEATFDASNSSDPDGDIIDYSWNFGDGSSTSGMIVRHTYDSSGSYGVDLTVTDNDGATDTTTKTVSVTEPSSQPTASFTAEPKSGSPPLEVTFDASDSYDSDGSINSYEWGFGDGSTGTGVSTTHTYQDEGSYTAQLTVTDNDGNEDSTSRQIEVGSPQEDSFSGSGDTVTNSFSLTEGVAIFKLSHDGSSNFAVQLLDADTGELQGNIVNEIGQFDGEVLVGANYDNTTSSTSAVIETEPEDVKTEPGEYILEITADGNWDISYIQPAATVGSYPPENFSGSGYEVTEPLELEAGNVVFSFYHDGSSNFIVTLYHEDGSYQELLANEIGYYDGETSVSIGYDSYQPPPGTYYLDVTADGNWEIDVAS